METTDRQRAKTTTGREPPAPGLVSMCC